MEEQQVEAPVPQSKRISMVAAEPVPRQENPEETYVLQEKTNRAGVQKEGKEEKSKRRVVGRQGKEQKQGVKKGKGMKKNLSQSPHFEQISMKSHNREASKSSKRLSLYQTSGSSASDLPPAEEHIEKHFCRKYSRIQMGDAAATDVFQRQQFEAYKRHTKENRLEIFRQQMSPVQKMSKKESEKCFERLSRDAERRKSMDKMKERVNSSSRSKSNKKMSAKKAEKMYQRMMM